MDLTAVLSNIHAQITHVASQLEGDLAAPAVQQIKANLEAELARLAQEAEAIAAKVIEEIEDRVAGRIATFYPDATTQANRAAKVRQETAESSTPPAQEAPPDTSATLTGTVPTETAPAPRPLRG